MDQKIENLLNISLDVSEEEREKSIALSTGYDTVNNEWEVIVRYSDDIAYLVNKYPGTQIQELLGGYGIIRTKEEFINPIAMEESIDYMEKPKPLFYQLEYGKIASCIYEDMGSLSSYGLEGTGVITAIIDSGIDILDEEFRNSDGTTRILSYWDQQSDTVYNDMDINSFITLRRNPAPDTSGHGTNVALIACGNSGVAKNSDIIAVKLGVANPNGFPRTVEIMTAIDYVVRFALDSRKPVAINISLGNNYGSHRGNSILENYINYIYGIWKIIICIGSGNEGVRGIHVSGILNDNEEQLIELAVGTRETSINLQIWKSYADDFEINIISPSGRAVRSLVNTNEVAKQQIGGTQIIGFLGEPSPYEVSQEIYYDFIPVNDYIDSGIWQIRLIPHRIVEGSYDMWLPSAAILNSNTGFLKNDPQKTLTIPSTAEKVITVGSYNQRTDAYSDFSGRGYMCGNFGVKPELVAPGENIILKSQMPSQRNVTGTSFATPFVTGAGALLMEWGVIRGNDPYLYGDKVKAYLIKGARQLPGMASPNPMTGDCVKLVLG